MAIDPVGTTLGSIALFLSLYNVCDALIHGYKLTLRFGDDFVAVQRELDMQWARLDLLMRSRRVLKSEIDPENPSSRMSTTVSDYLGQMQRYFQVCHDLMKKYDAEGMTLFDIS
jgi:Prion-inhibition and propagation